MFSVIIPVYNKADTLPRAIQSILAQTVRDWELIVVDDGSTDSFEDAIKQFSQDRRIRVIRQKNAGVSVARNTGITAAQGQYLCFLDADDEYLPNHLEVDLNMIQEFPGAGAYVTALRLVMPDGSSTDTTHFFLQQGTYREEHLFEYTERIGGKIVMGTLTACINQTVLARTGLFQPGEKVGEDTDFFFRLGAYYPVVFNQTITSVYHREASTATRDSFFNENWYFQKREAALLNDVHVSDQNKQFLQRYMERFRIHKARHLLLLGRRKEAAAVLRSLANEPVLRWKRLATWVMLLVPRPILCGLYQRKR